jgi:hypothetical protein
MGAVMATEGFAQIRNGLKEHIEAGKLCPTDLGVYTFLHLYCDYATGIYKGTALGIAFRMGDASYKGMVNKSLARLKKIRFINYREGKGKRGGYQILIDKFEPTFGELRGRRLNAWKSDSNGIPTYDAGTVEERSRNGEETVEERLRKSQGRVRERIPYIQTKQTGIPTDFHTSSDVPGDDDAATLPSVPTEGGTGKTEAAEPVTLAPLVPLPSQDESVPVTPTPHAATLQTSVAPTEGLTDIRLWNTPAFGVSAERLRNCLIYVLDFYENDYYCKNPPTVASMGREKFITMLNENTPVGWTPETHGVRKSKPKPAGKPETDAEKSLREYDERIKRIKTFRCTHCGENGVKCKCSTNAVEVAAYLREGTTNGN